MVIEDLSTEMAAASELDILMIGVNPSRPDGSRVELSAPVLVIGDLSTEMAAASEPDILMIGVNPSRPDGSRVELSAPIEFFSNLFGK